MCLVVLPWFLGARPGLLFCCCCLPCCCWSAAAADRFGFRLDAVARHARGGERRPSHPAGADILSSQAYYSILDFEWPAVEAALRRWLAPENFDEAGVQRRRLQEFQAEGRPRL